MDFDNIPTGVALDTTALEALERKASDNAKALTKHISELQQGLRSREATLQEALEAKVQRHSPEDRRIVRDIETRDIARQVNELRREVVALSDEHRTEMLRQMAGVEQQLAAVESLCQSPQQMLTRAHTGDPKKAAYLQALKLGGPAALRTHAELAVATGDVALASACMIANDALATKQRPFRSASLAERILGPEHKAVIEKLAAIRTRLRAAVDLNNEFVRGRTDATSKIARGIASRKAAGGTRNAAA